MYRNIRQLGRVHNLYGISSSWWGIWQSNWLEDRNAIGRYKHIVNQVLYHSLPLSGISYLDWNPNFHGVDIFQDLHHKLFSRMIVMQGRDEPNHFVDEQILVFPEVSVTMLSIKLCFTFAVKSSVAFSLNLTKVSMCLSNELSFTAI